jgi:hypothetical protein
MEQLQHHVKLQIDSLHASVFTIQIHFNSTFFISRVL